MIRGIALVLLLTVVLAPHSGHAKKEKWLFRPAYSAAQFKVKHLLITTVYGSFSQVEGELYLDPDDISQSSVNASINVNNLFSGDSKRDKLLKGKDFFWVATYPFMTFSSKRVELVSENRLLVSGELSLHGVSKEVTLEVDGPTPTVNDSNGIPSRAMAARTRLDRKDFGITWNETLDGGGVVVGDEVIVEINVELVRAAPPGKKIPRVDN